MSLVEFDLRGIDARGLCRATLEMDARVDGDLMRVWVFAAGDLGWKSETVTWNNAPLLGGTDSLLRDAAGIARPAGQLTVGASDGVARIDVTDTLAALDGAQRVTFIVINQPSSDEDTAEDGVEGVLLPAADRGRPPRLRAWSFD